MRAGGGPPGPGSAAVRPATLAWLACTCAKVMSVWLCFPNCVLLLCRGFPVHTRLADAAREPHTHLPLPLKGGDWVQPRTPAPSPASCSAVYPSGPRLSWALWVWLPGVSGPVCGQIGLGRASWRAASGAVGVQGHLGGSLGCRACLSCSCVFFPMLFGGPEAREVHSCVHGAHTLPTPTATQILKCLCVFGSPGPVCLHTFPHV